MESLGFVLMVFAYLGILCLFGLPVGLGVIAKKRGYSVAMFVALGGVGLVCGLAGYFATTTYGAFGVVGRYGLRISLILVALGFCTGIGSLFVPRKRLVGSDGITLPIPLPPGNHRD